MSAFLVAAVMIVGIMAMTIAFTVKVLSSTPVRIAVVIAAIVAMLTPLPRVFESLQPQNQQPATVAPSQPNSTGTGAR
ncbi:hypothetical protein SLUN_19505 [Streptomyces lunaelactis]|uniref:Uncharacterized protein n=1 Tax=Streptomyces lunaelactis TaxID=1535768 RepID=A0A2R4T4E5_9ACTN|nr:hypothetical protein [Streptomyces lunaelactis]AVZ74023.1 hypothetical protein SLUN_19505 [Streptomyces lunaelactis]NUK85171.1 hypothetical protein [Streptomyces lunaelactis]